MSVAVWATACTSLSAPSPVAPSAARSESHSLPPLRLSSSGDARSAISALDDKPQPRNIRFNSFIPLGSRTSDAFSEPGQETFVGVGHCRFKLPKCFKRKMRFPETIEPHKTISLLFQASCIFLAVCGDGRLHVQRDCHPTARRLPLPDTENTVYWLIFDYTCDIIYILDILIFKGRLRFTDNGIVETDRQKTKKHYYSKWMFKFDIFSLMPLDLFYILVGISGTSVWLRLPRIFKIQTFWEFYERCDQAAKSSAHAVRIVKTMTYMLYLIHIETCGYYAVSVYEGIGINRWVYSGKGNAYIRCFYLATKTATSIGNNPKPTNNLEYMFMTFYWLSGVFVFALLIGQIRDIVEAAGQVKDNYRKKMDAAMWYMQSINISHGIQDRVRKWFLYNWEQSKTIDERSLVAALPRKLQADLAINVHFNTLSKVQLFQDCERNLLYDLVLKLKPNVFLPGDYICRKVGRSRKEMYIVSQGQVEVLGGENNERVLATLTEGSVFGEISLLAMAGGGNRRTADVRCKGYTNVFTLSKSDFEEAMTEYPEAQKLLKKRAKRLLRENAKLEKKCQKTVAEEIIKPPSETPKLVKTVLQVLNPESTVAQRLGSSIKRSSTTSNGNHLQVPGPQHKTRNIDHAQRNNMAFDISDEQLQPHIKTDFYGDDYRDIDVNDNECDEVLIVERIEQATPDLDVDDENLGAEDSDISDVETGERNHCSDEYDPVSQETNFCPEGHAEFVEPDMWKQKRGKDVKKKRRKMKEKTGDEAEKISINDDSQDSGFPTQSTEKFITPEDSKDHLDTAAPAATLEHPALQKRHSSPATTQLASSTHKADEEADNKGR
ncbi:hypothetical protein C0Q70_19501 [Pomacea canaliculata]|uniref:Cyclic nucleotide-binding domain-containing protein n=1 Tax=Pomacea canaliculata TaxID=400727 RepID=A0A2T7NJJ4_POMCA|nr:hypothetical protein C0Q70_19501 [Pomacea canaliculata]